MKRLTKHIYNHPSWFIWYGLSLITALPLACKVFYHMEPRWWLVNSLIMISLIGWGIDIHYWIEDKKIDIYRSEK